MIDSQLPIRFFQRPLLMTPKLTERPWGGSLLASRFGKVTSQAAGPIGESWELSDHPDGRSTVEDYTFGDLLQAYPHAMIGRDVAPEKYPILIKYIDAEGDLSVQVHPSNEWCRTNNHNDLGKSECWYVMDCAPNTRVVYGYREGVTAEAIRAALRDGTVEDLLHYEIIQPGDFLAVPPGIVHAMLRGTLVCEIQQSSNTTFRLFDWNRKPERQLHIEQGMDVSNLDSTARPPIQRLGTEIQRDGDRPDAMNSLLDNEYFRVDHYQLAANCSVARVGININHGAIVNVVQGSGKLAGKGYEANLKAGETYFLPAAIGQAPGATANAEGLRLLITYSHEV